MSKTQHLLFGTALLTAAGLISRFIGFFYRIFLSQVLGAEGLGIYQLIFPLFNLAYACSVMGIQTALSQCIASHLANQNKTKAWNLFYTGICISFMVSVCIGIILFYSCNWICLSFLQEPQCIPLVRMMAFIIPIGTLHIVMVSWYFASRNTWIPSIAQLLEQIFRVGSTWFLYLLLLHHNIEATPILAVFSIAIGELFSFCFVFLFLIKDFRTELGSFSHLSLNSANIKELITLSAPLTANRIFLNLMRSIETILIPITLKSYGLNSKDALSVYGTLTGMALPLILFPSSITHAVSVMLLPKIAQDYAIGNHKGILSTVEKTIRYGLIIGIFCFSIFRQRGEIIGMLLYHNETAGYFICALSFLCPFMYLSSTLTSIINGLGKTGFSFFQSSIGIILRILFTVFFVPHVGIIGYLWGILGNEMILVFLSIYMLHREQLFRFSAVDSLLKPVCFIIIASGCAVFSTTHTALSNLPAVVALPLYCIIACCIYLYLLLTFNLIHLPKISRHL